MNSQLRAGGLAEVQRRISTAAERAGRKPSGITLVAVSKTKGPDDILPVLRAGHRIFGENRVQEAAAKWPALRRDHAGIALHLIGPLQTNKVADAIGLFDAIESLDREKLAHVVAREMARQGRRPTCFIQVNTGAEPQKAGVLPDAADRFIALCRDELMLPVAGLMCIPPVGENPARHFDQLAAIARRNQLASLSMGMSGDFEIAVAHGATHVRVGSAIFGERETTALP